MADVPLRVPAVVLPNTRLWFFLIFVVVLFIQLVLAAMGLVMYISPTAWESFPAVPGHCVSSVEFSPSTSLEQLSFKKGKQIGDQCSYKSDGYHSGDYHIGSE